MSDPWFAASNVLVVAGKGGVGKTTVGASVAIAAARARLDVLVVELEGHSSLTTLFELGAEPAGRGTTAGSGTGLGYDEIELRLDRLELPGRIRARHVRPDDALADYLDRAGLGPLTRRLTRSGAIEVVATAAPGIRDLLALGKIRQIEQAGEADLIVVDAPATGHALTFLTAPAGLADASTTGPVRDQADRVLEMFADDRRCQVALVTLPEETPVSETVEAAFALEDDVGLKLAPVVINGVWPEVPGLVEAASGRTGSREAKRAARYRLGRQADQRSEIERLATELPLPQVELPYVFTTGLGVDDLSILADALTGGRR
ncbi:MAG: ArsA-related P-loop ATPase [Actinomycetota bacterium]